jgi:hypothetical protein
MKNGGSERAPARRTFLDKLNTEWGVIDPDFDEMDIGQLEAKEAVQLIKFHESGGSPN